MIWVLVCTGFLILLLVYGFFPSAEIFFVLLLLIFLSIIYTIEVFRTCCCKATDVQNLQPDLKPKKLKDPPGTAAVQTRNGKFKDCETKWSKKKGLKREALTGCKAGSSGLADLAECRTRAQPDKPEVGSAMLSECSTSEVANELCSDKISKEQPIYVLIEDDPNDHGGIVSVEAMNGSGIIEIPDGVIEVVVEEKQLPKVLKDLGPTLEHKRPRGPPCYPSTYV